MPAVLLLLVGLVALIAGAELVLRCGSLLARRLGISPMVIGLTVVSLGTSAPELAVGIDASRSGAGSLMIGNIAGTNIVNLLLILGLSATIRPIVLSAQTFRLDLPAMAVASVLLLVLALDNSLSAVDGSILVVLALVYTLLLARITRRETVRALADEYGGEVSAQPPRRDAQATAVQVAGLLVGIVVIVLGADWLVRGAVDVARAAGVSDAFIGLTIIAIGTSAPELATTVVATIRGDRDIAIGNLMGSNTYNLTFVVGTSLFFAPSAVSLPHELVAVDLPAMVITALVCIPVFLTGRRVSRREGIIFLTGYAAFLTHLLATRL